MKNYLEKQWEEICAIDQSSEIYRIFIRVAQAFCVIAAAVQALIFLPGMFTIGFGGDVNPAYLAIPFALTVGQILLLSYAERLIQKGSFRGTLIGLAASLLCVPSVYLPLGIFGLYCFLNPGYQRKHLANAPAPFVDFLKLLKIDYTKEEVAVDVTVTRS